MALIENHINLDESIIDKFFNSIKEFFNQPPLLKAILIFSIIVAAGYFSLSYFTNKSQINELNEKVTEIDEKINDVLNIDDYQQNLLYVITEIKLLEYSLEQNYQERLYELDCIERFAEHYHPGDPIIADFDAMKVRMEMNYKSYNQHYNIVMKHLDKILENNDEKFQINN